MGTLDPECSLGGVRLIWADFPNGCAIDKMELNVPMWNVFKESHIEAAFCLAGEYLMTGGTLVCTIRGEHFGFVMKEADNFNFKLSRTLYIRLPTYLYLPRDHGGEEVSFCKPYNFFSLSVLFT